MEFHYICNDCGAEYDSKHIIYRCPACSGKAAEGEMQRGNLRTIIDPAYLKSLADKKNLSPFDFFPYEIPTPQAYPVGNTPLLGPERLRKRYKVPRLFLKNDGMNPSGSFKDRASQLVVGQALHFGEQKVALASTGNAGSAMACAGAAYGLEIILFVPETAPRNKLMQSVLYGATVVPVKGTYDDAFGLSIEFTEKHGGINRNTAYNPMTVEGKKSVAIELFLQFARRAPEYVYVPVGDGVIYSGVVKGFKDLLDAGLIERLPKVICVQSTKSNAIAQAWESGEAKTIPAATTKADSISVASPANGRMAVDFINECKGWASQVSDEAIIEAELELCKEAGLFAEPAASAAWAGYKQDLASGKITPEAEAVVLLTGIGFKDMKAVEDTIKMPNSVEPKLDAVEAFLFK
ncbi:MULTISPECIES: threonine synthase [Sediminispirochaeta]|uniref:Pyridoxal-5'-phosphate-dependent protein beta subunit n=1 Tax=Sediminispirochaeta smaragdinae (strain DSM 11293 / JCM 15392 / SEBR 4228) TaxID=573413 RepID=E1R489_SEDSS|nr:MULTISPECIES: pyridoxal-phosphate dependent enzyme [Sediminispirochaeta]ADK80511.1 Pyridoxal-5'-phosphate-dependent protein beta subunit [Sediminispirochaeta smaragdinae DSM 11293]